MAITFQSNSVIIVTVISNVGFYNIKRHQVYSQKNDDEFEMDMLDVLADHSQEEARQRQEDYDEICQKIRQVLKREQADMIIAICLDGMVVSEYAHQINETPKKIYDRFDYAKKVLKDILAKSEN